MKSPQNNIPAILRCTSPEAIVHEEVIASDRARLSQWTLGHSKKFEGVWEGMGVWNVTALLV